MDRQQVLDKVKTESGTDLIVKAEIDERSSNSKVAKIQRQSQSDISNSELELPTIKTDLYLFLISEESN